MPDLDLSKPLDTILNERGYRSKIVSITHIKELEKEIMTRYQKGLLDQDLYDTYLASFDYSCYRKLKDARSLFVVSVPQPQVQVAFLREDKSYTVIIPPTYCFATDDQVTDILRTCLEPQGYQLQKVRLPEKLLTVCSGLGRYGKNNITYVDGMGSFQRPVVFISDYPLVEDSWNKAAVLDQCETCNACIKACPTDAIRPNRFQLYAERCLTFHNERSEAFPRWLSPAWHNCLVGCMICQKVCPANKNVVGWVEAGATFDNAETDLILNGVPAELLPPETAEKLKRQGMLEYYNVLGRNLKTLIEKTV